METITAFVQLIVFLSLDIFACFLGLMLCALFIYTVAWAATKATSYLTSKRESMEKTATTVVDFIQKKKTTVVNLFKKEVPQN